MSPRFVNALAWTVVGFAAGVATSSVVFVLALSLWRSDAHFERQAAQADAAAVATTDSHPLLNADPLGELNVVQRVAMMRWMAANPSYELITRDYCGCLDIIEPECPSPDFVSRRGDHPYAEALDYNGDGYMDFAIVLGAKGKEGPQLLLIFNGPFGDDVPTPAFRADGLQENDHVHGGFVGPPESDNGYNIKAKGATYELVYMGAPG